MLRASAGDNGTSCRQQAPHPFWQEIHLPRCAASASAVATTLSERICNSGRKSPTPAGPAGTLTDMFSVQEPIVAWTSTVAVCGSHVRDPPEKTSSLKSLLIVDGMAMCLAPLREQVCSRRMRSDAVLHIRRRRICGLRGGQNPCRPRPTNAGRRRGRGRRLLARANRSCGRA